MIAPLIPAMPYRQYACLPSSFFIRTFCKLSLIFYTTSQVRWSPVQTHRHKSTTNPFHVIHFLLLVLWNTGDCSPICVSHCLKYASGIFHPAKQILPSPCLYLFLLSVWHLVCLHVVNIHLVQSHTKACNAGTALFPWLPLAACLYAETGGAPVLLPVFKKWNCCLIFHHSGCSLAH